MFRLTQSFVLLVLVGVFVMDVGGWWRRRRRRSTVHQHVHHTSINNCQCHVHHHYGRMAEIVREAKASDQVLHTRDVAAALGLEVDYPGLDRFVDYLNAKRDTFALEQLEDVMKRANQYSSSHNPNWCHCGRALVDQFNMETL